MIYTSEGDLMKRSLGTISYFLEWPKPLCVHFYVQRRRVTVSEFNSDRWKAAKNRIRNYSVKDCTRGLHFVNLVPFNRHLLYSHSARQTSKAIHPPHRFPEDNPIIVIPNSVWTAGWLPFHIIFIVIRESCCGWSNVQDLASLLAVGVYGKLLQCILRAYSTKGQPVSWKSRITTWTSTFTEAGG